jgi:hypothetical protein
MMNSMNRQMEMPSLRIREYITMVSTYVILDSLSSSHRVQLKKKLGLMKQSADGIEDTTFCLRLPSTAKTWGGECYYSWDTAGETVNGQGSGKGNIPPLSKKPAALLFFRARSSVSTIISAIIDRH